MSFLVDRLLELFDLDSSTGKLFWKVPTSNRVKPGDSFGHYSQGYIRGSVDGKKVMAHKIVWAITYGEWPDFELDHINLDRSDNRASNLRKADRSQNFFNKEKYSTNTSGYKGVTRRGNKWIAQIAAYKEAHYLGTYDTPEQAHAAYIRAAEHYHKDYART